MAVQVSRRQCALLLLLAVTTPCHVSVASPVSATSNTSPAQTVDVDLLMPSVQPQMVRRQWLRDRETADGRGNCPIPKLWALGKLS